MARLKLAVRLGVALCLSGHIGNAIAACSNEETSTITETTQVSSLAASCPTYTGDLQLINVTRTINMTGVETIIGDITYSNDFPDEYVTFYSATLKNVTGDLLMYGAGGKVTKTPGDLNITLPALRAIDGLGAYWGWGDVSINTDPKLNIPKGFQISSGASQSAAGNLYLNVSYTYSIGVSGVDFQATGGALFTSSAEKVEREIMIVGNTGLERVELDDLKFVNYTVDIKSNSDLDYISLSLSEVGLLRVKENGRDTHLSVPNVKKLGGRSDPGRHTSGGDAGGIFRDLVNASLPLLTEVHGDDVDWFKGKLNFTSNFFSELSLPSLRTANCTLGIDENIALNDFSVPRLNYVKDLQIHDNPRLLNFTANLLKKADNINMTGPFTNVEFFGLEVITGDFYLAGDKTMDCSWFDEHFLNHIVQGSYKCVGNHTKPATERKPSTPTDEADLEDDGSKQGGSSSSGSGESSSSGSNGGLSTGAKAGIGAGVGVAGLILLGLGAGFLIGKKGKRPPGAVTHTTESGYQKAELDGDGKPSSGAKQVHSVEASEMQDTGKSELPLNPARAELAG
ncbi:sporulation-specific Sps2p [Fusarium agapanthi]|uniref:Sporulation-specific Sps2p n=1 Tax=Fusarium agapanthi TaxID=1803897 RepID=A0A9P5BDQ6_9HYPO|nr:sporulation-specific Sps2p [Fusarium agapanthi]